MKMSKSKDEDQMELLHELKKLELNALRSSSSHLSQQPSKNVLVNNGIGSEILLNNDTNLPVSLNPFFHQIKFHKTTNNDEYIKSMFGTNYNRSSCEYEDNKVIETGINEYAAIKKDNLLRQSNNKSRNHKEYFQHSLLRETKFKSKTLNKNKKLILRESLLKILQNSNDNDERENDNDKSIQTPPNSEKLEDTSVRNTNLSMKDDGNNSNNRFINKTKFNFNSSTNEFLDFRNLVEECNLIPYTNNKSNKSLSLNIDKINNELKNNMATIPFTTMQKRNNEKLLRKSYLKAIAEDSYNSKSIENEVEPKASCSQQARVNISTDSTCTCDITIDELASYFETLVHIPKKMSDMAERMYI